MSASFGQWSLVAFLLSRGADPDLKDNQGKSVRTQAAAPDLPPRKPADAAALEQIRARLAHK
ncbi:ankyrin repeat domain-containing protein [Sphingomonas prati]|uniref:Ankyrin repeat domain-containing protein n=1 Tax=Sphingomonas prati TaxID=1843237 RepID=A0A7W9F1T2_9SPHN|nr:ankyrin repeat domain-containing protein [Sphingomonas prati]MBB5727760.1 hypothetical protein [Sphingomonas prati]GGE80477.1 hypothetical protein GCM10011404_11520 [Sphingomonas prati]